MIAELRQALEAHLRTAFPGFAVEGYPDDPRTYTLRSQRGAVLVRYDGRTFTRPEGDLPFDVRTARFALSLVMRNLRRDTGRATQGIEDAVSALTAAVTGLVLTAGGKRFVFYPESDDFDAFDEKQGTWTYEVLATGHHTTRLELP